MSDEPAASDDGNAFVGTEAAAAKLDTLLARPGVASAVAADDAYDGDVDAWADVGPFYDTATVASVLGVTVAAVRSRRARGSLLAMRTGSGAWVYPVWQFDGSWVLLGLAKVLQVLSVGNVSGWTVAAWLCVSPLAELDGRTPLEALATDKDLVLLVASHAAAGWAR